MKKTITPLTAKRIAAAVAAVCATLSLPASASDTKAMLDLMLKKGVITQKDYDEFIEANKEADENKAFKDQRIDQDVSKATKFVQKHEKDGTVKSSGLGWVSEDGKNEINLTGRLHFDARALDGEWGNYSDRDSSLMADRFTARRARIGVTGVFDKNINYEMVTNLVGSSANLLDTAWANYKFSPEAQVRVGRFKQPYGLETLVSSNNISFMERSYQDQIAPGKQLGAMFHGEQSNGFTYSASIFQAGFDKLSSTGGFEVGARTTYNLAQAISGAGDDFLFHIGLAATSGKTQILPTTSSQSGSATDTKGAFIAFNDEFGGLKNVYRNRIYGTSPCVSGGVNVTCTDKQISAPASDASDVNQTRVGGELAVAKGPFKFQAEYTNLDQTVTGKSAASASPGTLYDVRASGITKVYYMEVMYNLTGEPWAPTYKSGVVGAIKPAKNFSFDSMNGGAWQVGLRYSAYDASDFGNNTSTSGGATTGTYGGNNAYEIEGSPKGNTMTVGLNWILNPNARIMFNYAQSRFDYSFKPVDIGSSVVAATRGQTSNAFMIRSQFNF